MQTFLGSCIAELVEKTSKKINFLGKIWKSYY